ncbi:hypothetical protein NUU61_000995 [Penicillium alfredii]|uniref:Uncharacterized protein n=1 Tax=Penicillium alfredii TaxID=1506179 RepID=A0A9W9GAT2_9EURO|nr:uncharacterized protein NUU61_000995 [Penicillium alfredii]KAJ5115236.1 hypothetical protein NUU61_000995 [Penicillium alfredii]
MPANLEIPDDILQDIRDQVVLITGGSSGIGRATAQLCLNLGAHVLIGDVNPPKTEFEHSERLKYIKVDVTTWESVRAMFIEAEQVYNRIDHVFVNAGVAPTTNFLDDTLDESGQLAPPNMRTIDVNLVGMIYTVRLAAHYIKKLASQRPADHKTGSSIVVTASASSFQIFSIGDYTVSKHGVVGLLRGMVSQLEGEIRINAVAPSWTDSAMIPKPILESLGVTAQPAEAVARSVLFLFVDRARHGDVIYSWEGKYREVNNSGDGFLAHAASILPNSKNEEGIVTKIREMARSQGK